MHKGENGRQAEDKDEGQDPEEDEKTAKQIHERASERHPAQTT